LYNENNRCHKLSVETGATVGALLILFSPRTAAWVIGLAGGVSLVMLGGLSDDDEHEMSAEKLANKKNLIILFVIKYCIMSSG
jgi:hypothetical protein